MAFRGGTLRVTDSRLDEPEAEGGVYSSDLGARCGQLPTKPSAPRPCGLLGSSVGEHHERVVT
jgi:hypothetical protein